MEKADLEELRRKVPCNAVLEDAGFELDLKESTRRAMKYRRASEIIIVIHGGKGWFDPLSDAKGDVFSLVEHLDGLPFAAALYVVADLVGFTPCEPVWTREASDRAPDLTITERWQDRRKPRPGSATWRYLRDTRHVPEEVIRNAVAANLLREGPKGSMWAGHTDDGGHVTGWEERGPDWRGFATGGAKVLFRLGQSDAVRLCVTEAAIDAMSLAAMEELRANTLYLSTGGGWAPATAEALRTYASRPRVHLVAATDNNAQGETYAGRLRDLAAEAGSGFERMRPLAEDWNAELARNQEAGRRENSKEDGCRMPAGRLKGDASPG
ncbi:DUF3991 domain-containing protein [Mesorhizobium microcysteis]|uniref:DUF3991 domain-containing protein n=1 Tax=Neoaquamicrobium microcysteis TaxID=2682781 RepID=A0A5D4H5C7_9HYPH|nr:DUF3991 and toprim domain-containing protein [Mesorhizobium microcysteis]TYR35492.1 DUF3991 domain-containing protein [Mesorhizobium microcysteis]